MTTLTVQSVDKDGLVYTTVEPGASGDQFVASDDQRTFVVFENGSGSPITVTVPAQRASAPQQGTGPDVAVANIALAVAAGGRAVIPVLPNYIRTNDGVVQVTTSAQTDAEIAIIRLPRLA